MTDQTETLRPDGDGYLVLTWVPHKPSGVVVLPGHPQLGGRYCLTDGGDWPCALVRSALTTPPAAHQHVRCSVPGRCHECGERIPGDRDHD